MAVINIGLRYGFDIRGLDFSVLNDGSSIAALSTVLVVESGTYRDYLYGSGFTYNAQLDLTGGLVTRYVETLSGASAISVSGLNVSGMEVGNAAGTAGLSDDHAVVRAALAGNDTFNGGNLRDYLIGFGGNDTLRGKGGADILIGDKGNDVITGGPGIDTEYGGAGNDHFVFNAALSAANRDVIRDFGNARGNNDTIRLENGVMKALGGTGRIDADFFHNGRAAHDADDHVIYNKATGYLYYDSNGNAAGGATLIGVVTNKPTLTASDFVVI